LTTHLAVLRPTKRFTALSLLLFSLLFFTSGRLIFRPPG